MRAERSIASDSRGAGAVLAQAASAIDRTSPVRRITPSLPPREKGGQRNAPRQLRAPWGALESLQINRQARQADPGFFQVCGTALRMALPPLMTTLNSMFFALCLCISSGTCERMREAIESKERPTVDSPQRWRATR